MRIGILGGTFNPVHMGHLLLAEGAREVQKLDQVLWIPTHLPPHKEAPEGATPADRLRMVELAIEGNSFFRFSSMEIERPPPSYTIDTMRQLSEDPLYRGAEWFFLIGSDAAQELWAWRQIDQLMRMVQFVAVPRPGHRPNGNLPKGVGEIPVKTAAVCASEIRSRIREGKSIRYWVPDSVLQYIQERGLYR